VTWPELRSVPPVAAMLAALLSAARSLPAQKP
jgi:hypothetical protein